jgi:alkylation response protein AidB-like acyl-CoA dehydrogenase
MTTQTAPRTANEFLTDDMLARFGERAPTYDLENRFFDEDFEELRKSGFLTCAVPADLGGGDFSLADVCRAQRRLAYRAPATALAVNMHIYWTGVAADLRRMGDPSLEWLLKEAAAGEIFAAGHGETGNDLPVLLSSARAERVDGGYRFTGHKMFSSLTPVWTRLGVHAMDASDPAQPKIVHGFLPRGSDGYIARVVPAGALDPFVGAIFANALLNFGAIYYSIAERARDVAITSARKRTSIALSRPMAYHPEIQHLFSEMQLELESMWPHLSSVAEDWSAGVDHGAAWPMKIVAAKYHCVEGAKKVVDLALTSSGGAGMFKTSELERLYRDVRAGGFHPANTTLTHEIVGKTTLGIGLDEMPRWG